MIDKNKKTLKTKKISKKQKNDFICFFEDECAIENCPIEQTKEIEIWKNENLKSFEEIKLNKEKKI